MSDVLDLTVHGDPATCRAAATDADAVRKVVASAADDARRAVSTAGSWSGRGGIAYENRSARRSATCASWPAGSPASGRR